MNNESRHSQMRPPPLPAVDTPSRLDGALAWAEAAAIAALVFVGIMLLNGCGAAPPRTITVSPDLPEDVQVAAAVAADAWCSAPVGWCPELVAEGGESEIRIEAFKGHSAQARANNGGRAIRVQPDTIGFWLDGMMTHEFGHYGIDGHVPTSALMRAKFDLDTDIPTTVDAQAAGEWCAQQGC